MMSIGRTDSLEEKLNAAKLALAQVGTSSDMWSNVTGANDAERAQLTQQIALLQQDVQEKTERRRG